MNWLSWSVINCASIFTQVNLEPMIATGVLPGSLQGRSQERLLLVPGGCGAKLRLVDQEII